MSDQAFFVDASVDIHAPANAVWDALTVPELTRRWLDCFGLPGGEIVSEWRLGSPVLWTDCQAMLVVEGAVTAVSPGKYLRFTVFDARGAARPPVSDEDGIAYRLASANGGTTLHVRHGDFSAIHHGETLRQRSAAIWREALARVKALAENPNPNGNGRHF